MPASEIDRPGPIYVVSGGTGATGELLVRTVLAQFHDVHVPIVIRSHVHDEAQVDAVVEEASGTGGSIVHTMVNGACRRHLIARAAAAGVFGFDMVTPLMEHLQALVQVNHWAYRVYIGNSTGPTSIVSKPSSSPLPTTTVNVRKICRLQT